LSLSLQAGVNHIFLAVSYRAEMLEKEMKEQEERVRGGGGGKGREREGGVRVRGRSVEKGRR
jgi:hypothetical protein